MCQDLRAPCFFVPFSQWETTLTLTHGDKKLRVFISVTVFIL